MALCGLCKCLLASGPCLGLGEPAGPAGHGRLSPPLTPPPPRRESSSLGSWCRTASPPWSCCCHAFPELLKPGWGPGISGGSLAGCEDRPGAAASRSRSACGLWVVNTGQPQPVLCESVCLDFLLLAVWFQRVTLLKRSFTVCIFFSQ